MKELTIEQKAQRYDEALEKAKALYKASEPMSGCNVILETLFPELKESEDEKIKNRLIKLIKMSNEQGGYALHKWEADEMLAWLEKQGEQKHIDKVEPKFKIGDLVKYTNHYKQPIYKVDYIDKECYVCTSNDATLGDKAIMHFAFDNPYLRLVEQKPVEENEGNIGGISANPAWSEEDKDMIRYIGNAITCNESAKYLQEKGVDIIKAHRWLESLKNRVQPKQEWSDVDKDILFRIIDDLKFLRDTISIDPKYAVNIIDMEREITWLKSLRPQNRWKPSELQLGCLSDAIEHYNSLGYPAPKLKELYEQLKKL